MISYLCYFISSTQMRLLLSCSFMLIWILNPTRLNNSIKVIQSFLSFPTSGNPKFHRAEVPAEYLFKMFWNLHSPLPVFQGWKTWNLINHLYLEKRSSGLWMWKQCFSPTYFITDFSGALLGKQLLSVYFIFCHYENCNTTDKISHIIVLLG